MALKTIEQFRTQATSEVESEKPLKSWNNGTLRELTDDEYAQTIEDRAQWYLDVQNNSYKVARQESYGAIGDQLDQLYWDIDAGKLDKTGEWYKAIKKVKDDNPKPE